MFVPQQTKINAPVFRCVTLLGIAIDFICAWVRYVMCVSVGKTFSAC